MRLRKRETAEVVDGKRSNDVWLWKRRRDQLQSRTGEISVSEEDIRRREEDL